MSTRGFVPWMAMLSFYCLTIAMLVTFFMVRCGSAHGTLFGDRISPSPDSVAATAAESPRGDTR